LVIPRRAIAHRGLQRSRLIAAPQRKNPPRISADGFWAEQLTLIPPSLIKLAEEIRDAAPELFEETLVHGVQIAGLRFFPTSATELVEVVNRIAQRDMASVPA
jgi:hypothetical protein